MTAISHSARRDTVGTAPNIDLKAIDLRIEGVSLAYGDNRVLNSIDLSVAPGEFFALLGPSGCGKTTLLRLIAGFAEADSGRVIVGGKDISHLPPWKRDVGMVFQSYALWPHLSVARNVAFGLEERRVPRAEVTRRVTAALDLVGLTRLADRRPSQLSGGQQQRVALARTIAVEPKILLLDEPLSNLDAKLRIQVRRELRDLQQRLGLTTILVTHDQEEANTICDRVAVMNAGEIQQVGPPTELYEAPANLFVANFLGTANILAGRPQGAGSQRAFDAGHGLRIPIAPDAAIPEGARMVFRPQDVTLLADAPVPNAGISGVISYREFLGASVRYGVRLGSAEILADMPFRAGDALYALGQPVTVSIATGSIHWLAA
ncbi:ABC transporter ATP-binding protein [Afipia sp. P52-10]|jgi:iron(III) transport system ATP-binding protein|uniref:ABC transporter ATP-binding protein n=1 Tax=Afipia sp. P52-10 TaxID=1429916 RepID=UPI0003DF0710|nr:ABC transporter ATP-binding protein [Afipia sp. P52-10]ETR76913.1 ABC transporter ATP-binding protein [Afipia sp. P52-10]